jgi:hypothetical protein
MKDGIDISVGSSTENETGKLQVQGMFMLCDRWSLNDGYLAEDANDRQLVDFAQELFAGAVARARETIIPQIVEQLRANVDAYRSL